MIEADRTAERVFVVSGGSRGIGRAIVDALLAQGHRVATFSRSPLAGGNAQTAIQEKQLFWRSVDARDTTAIEHYVREVVDAYGRIDGLVNNAGIATESVLAMAHTSDIDQMLDLNVKSALVLTKECVRAMLVQGSGTIVNISSIIAVRGFAGLSVYAATKAALAGITPSLARELGSRQIRVNTVAPGFVQTEMSASLDDQQRQQIIRRTPLGRLATTDDIVPVVLFLLSPDSRFITGQMMVVDGGASI